MLRNCSSWLVCRSAGLALTLPRPQCHLLEGLGFGCAPAPGRPSVPCSLSWGLTVSYLSLFRLLFYRKDVFIQLLGFVVETSVSDFHFPSSLLRCSSRASVGSWPGCFCAKPAGEGRPRWPRGTEPGSACPPHAITRGWEPRFLFSVRTGPRLCFSSSGRKGRDSFMPGSL